MNHSVQQLRFPTCQLRTINPGQCFEYEDKTYLKTDKLDHVECESLVDDDGQRVAVVKIKEGMVDWMRLDTIVKPLKQKHRLQFEYGHE